GMGCVYPAQVKTIANQLEAKGLSWKGYMEDMKTGCRHPDLGSADHTQSAEVGDQYAGRHNPFIYFHSIIDTPACRANVVPLPKLFADLRTVATTPNFSFITPNLCDDAHDATCAGKNYEGKNNQGGLYAADRFLRKVIPQIQASPAYQRDGLIIVTLDESGDIGTPAGATSCCAEPTGPNTPAPGQVGPGGGRIGTVVVSKRFVRPGTVSDVPYNHYSLLRSLEDLYRIGATTTIPGSDGRGHLGYAGAAGLVPFGKDVYDVAAATAAPPRAQRPSSGGQLAATGLPALLPAAALLLMAAMLRALRRRRRGPAATAAG
ncbi:MAG: alkaline phosphatase family protein, partial [Mycobacteriales bacterium]